jgi:hypothetical protein
MYPYETAILIFLTWRKFQVLFTLETSGEDLHFTLETSGEDSHFTLETSGEDPLFTLEMSVADWS